MSSGFSFLSRARAVLAAVFAVFGVVVNYGSTITTTSDAAWVGAIGVATSYGVFTVLNFLSNRVWWRS
jgi:predicted RND superfamily exporter protein